MLILKEYHLNPIEEKELWPEGSTKYLTSKYDVLKE